MIAYLGMSDKAAELYVITTTMNILSTVHIAKRQPIDEEVKNGEQGNMTAQKILSE